MKMYAEEGRALGVGGCIKMGKLKAFDSYYAWRRAEAKAEAARK